MIPVADALAHLFALVAPMGTEHVPLVEAAGRVLATPVTATRAQPPFAASAMDGYAVRALDAQPGASLSVVGESAAGHGWSGALSPGQAVRISTGAPIPEGADRVIIQEDVSRQADQIILGDTLDPSPHIRPAGADFDIGTRISAPTLLTPAHVALLASMNIATVPVHRRPDIALISTGDELVMPGDTPRADQIVASNSFGLKALLQAHGATCRLLPIARDTEEALITSFALARDADLIITIGGASVGDHDIVQKVAADQGLEREFYKVAMRPGKPLMAGRLRGTPVIGLPGNPVSAMVCGQVFLIPVVRAMLGLGQHPAPRLSAPLSAPVTANGPRAHYMRARVDETGIAAMERQDSALLTVLTEANALLIRPPHDPARKTGHRVDYIPITLHDTNPTFPRHPRA